MSNDYKLPSMPSLRLYQRGYERFDMEDYGHACAEHVRAPLLARIAELEAENSALAESIAIGPGVSEVKSASQEIDRLRAEVEKYKADGERCHEYVIKTRLQAIRVHQICNLSRIAYPEICELADDGALHEAVHDLLRIEIPNEVFDAARKGTEGDRLGEGSEG